MPASCLMHRLESLARIGNHRRMPDPALAALALATIAFVGRVALSLLPAGPPGSHAVTELPITWAASHLLGSLILFSELELARALGLHANLAALVLPWCFVLVLRYVTLPGGFVPRHAPRTEIGSALARSFAFAASLVVIAAACLRPELAHGAGPFARALAGRASLATPLTAANALAALCFCAAGLRTARRAPLGRGVVLLALSAMIAMLGLSLDDSALLMCAAGGAGFAVAWLRRADKRARMLSIFASAGAASSGVVGWTIALGLLVGLVARTATPARARTAALSAICLAVALAPAIAGERTTGSEPAAESLSRAARIAMSALLLVSAAWLAKELWFTRASPSNAEIEPPGRELSALALAAAVALGASVAVGALAPGRLTTVAIAPLLPICGVMVGLALVRTEQPFERA